MHPDRSERGVVDDDADQLSCAVCRCGCELLAGHQEITVSGDVHDRAIRVQQRGRHGSGHAVSHRARGRRELSPAEVLQAGVAAEAVKPAAVVAGAVGVDGIGRREPLDRHDHLGHVHRLDRRRNEIGLVVGVGPSR